MNDKEENITYEQQFKLAKVHFKMASSAKNAVVQIGCAGLLLTYKGPDAQDLLKVLADFCEKKEVEHFNKHHEKPSKIILK